MGDISQGRLQLGLVKRPEPGDRTYLVGYGPLLVCSCVSLLGAVITHRWTEKTINMIDESTTRLKLFKNNIYKACTKLIFFLATLICVS